MAHPGDMHKADCVMNPISIARLIFFLVLLVLGFYLLLPEFKNLEVLVVK